MSNKTWIEVALNGALGSKVQPGIPITKDEIVRDGVECIKAGAAILHAHPLDPDTTRQHDDLELCVGFIAGIREEVDAIVYPGLIMNRHNL